MKPRLLSSFARLAARAGLSAWSARWPASAAWAVASAIAKGQSGAWLRAASREAARQALENGEWRMLSELLKRPGLPLAFDSEELAADIFDGFAKKAPFWLREALAARALALGGASRIALKAMSEPASEGPGDARGWGVAVAGELPPRLDLAVSRAALLARSESPGEAFKSEAGQKCLSQLFPRDAQTPAERSAAATIFKALTEKAMRGPWAGWSFGDEERASRGKGAGERELLLSDARAKRTARSAIRSTSESARAGALCSAGEALCDAVGGRLAEQGHDASLGLFFSRMERAEPVGLFSGGKWDARRDRFWGRALPLVAARGEAAQAAFLSAANAQPPCGDRGEGESAAFMADAVWAQAARAWGNRAAARAWPEGAALPPQGRGPIAAARDQRAMMGAVSEARATGAGDSPLARDSREMSGSEAGSGQGEDQGGGAAAARKKASRRL